MLCVMLMALQTVSAEILMSKQTPLTSPSCFRKNHMCFVFPLCQRCTAPIWGLPCRYSWCVGACLVSVAEGDAQVDWAGCVPVSDVFSAGNQFKCKYH